MSTAEQAGNAVASEKSHVAAVEYACSIVEDFFGETPKDVCRLLFRHGPLSLRDIRMQSGLPRSAISKALMVLVQHGHVKALLHEQVAPSRIFAAVRQPAFLVHVSDTIGDFAAKVCEQLVFNGRLTFDSLVQNVAAELPEGEANDLPARVASSVISLMQERLVEQTSCVTDTRHGTTAKTSAPVSLTEQTPSVTPICRSNLLNAKKPSQVSAIAGSATRSSAMSRTRHRKKSQQSTSLATGQLVKGEERLQAPPCDMPLCYAKNKSSARTKSKTKLSDGDKRLESGRELTLAQYSKIRYRFPAEVMAAASGGTAMDLDSDAPGGECVLLRLNCDAFEVHFRHEATVEWVTAGHGEAMAKVAKAMLDLTRPAELSNLGQATAIPAVPVEAILEQVNRNARAAANDDAAGPGADGGGDVKMEDGEATEDEAKPAVHGDTDTTLEEIDAIIFALKNSAIVVEDDSRPGHFLVEAHTTTFMLKNNALAGYLKQRFTDHGHRVFQLLLEHKYLPVDIIEKIAMLGTRTVRTVLHVLFQHGYITVQEIPKTAEHAPSKTIFLYHAEMSIAYAQIMHDLHKAAGNLMRRTAHDTQRSEAVLRLARRNLAGENVKLSQAQYKEAAAWQHRTKALHAALLSLDGMLRIFQLHEDLD